MTTPRMNAAAYASVAEVLRRLRPEPLSVAGAYSVELKLWCKIVRAMAYQLYMDNPYRFKREQFYEACSYD